MGGQGQQHRLSEWVSDRLFDMCGRLNPIYGASYDQDLPLEVDDEYWEPSDASYEPFKQPPGQPSKTTFWVQFVKLIAILSNAQRSIVSGLRDFSTEYFLNLRTSKSSHSMETGPKNTSGVYQTTKRS